MLRNNRDVNVHQGSQSRSRDVCILLPDRLLPFALRAFGPRIPISAFRNGRSDLSPHAAPSHPDSSFSFSFSNIDIWPSCRRSDYHRTKARGPTEPWCHQGVRLEVWGHLLWLMARD